MKIKIECKICKEIKDVDVLGSEVPIFCEKCFHDIEGITKINIDIKAKKIEMICDSEFKEEGKSKIRIFEEKTIIAQMLKVYKDFEIVWGDLAYE